MRQKSLFIMFLFCAAMAWGQSDLSSQMNKIEKIDPKAYSDFGVYGLSALRYGCNIKRGKRDSKIFLPDGEIIKLRYIKNKENRAVIFEDGKRMFDKYLLVEYINKRFQEA